MSRAVIPRHGREMHRCNGEDPIPVLLHKWVFPAAIPVATTGGERWITITDDLAGTYLRSAHAALVVAGGALEIMLHNFTQGVDMLNDPIVIASGDTNSYESDWSTPDITGTPPNNYVLRGDQIRIDVVTASGTGLEVLPEFGPQLVTITP